jgi:AhpD family alkylhydroperoxidase
MLKERFSIKNAEPDAYKAMAGLDNFTKNSSIKPIHREMIKVRASQVNGCAYCIEIHTKDARQLGETEQRLYALSAWWESPLFTDEEKAVLALTDEVTKIANGGVTDATYNALKMYYSEQEIAQLIMQVIAINAWNRIAISTHMVHKH